MPLLEGFGGDVIYALYRVRLPSRGKLKMDLDEAVKILFGGNVLICS